MQESFVKSKGEEREMVRVENDDKKVGTKVVIANFYITDEAESLGYMQLDLKVIGKRDPMLYAEIYKAIEKTLEEI